LFSPAFAVPGGHTPLELVKRSRGATIAAAWVKATSERIEKRMFWAFIMLLVQLATGEAVQFAMKSGRLK
jgi:hypothetical protein